jgi:hypothetical protein
MGSSPIFGDSYSKFNDDGQVEDYWCDTGEKIVVPPQHFDYKYMALKCNISALSVFHNSDLSSLFVTSFQAQNEKQYSDTWVICDT